MIAIKFLKIAVVISACFVVFWPTAARAWTPCMPFCDSTCGAPALITLGTSIQAAYAQQQAQLQALGSEINSTNNAILSFSQNYVDTISNDTFDRLSSLDASTARIESGWAQIVKAKENLSDFKLTQWKTSIDKYFNASRSAETLQMFGEASQSESGRLGTCAAGEIKRAQYSDKQVSAEIIDVQKRYLDDLRAGDSALAVAIKNESQYVGTNALALLHDSSIPDEQLGTLQGLLSYIITPRPKSKIDDVAVTPGMEREALDHKRTNISSTWIAGIAAEVLSRRAVYGDLQCEESYVATSSASAGSSMTELMKSKINGRIEADGYWGAVKQLLPAGLRRELVYLKAEENMLLYQRYQIRERRNQLLAFIAANRVRTGDQ